MSESEQAGTEERTWQNETKGGNHPHLPVMAHIKEEDWGPDYQASVEEDDSQAMEGLIDVNANKEIIDGGTERLIGPESKLSIGADEDKGNELTRQGEECSITSNPDGLTASEISTIRRVQLAEFCRICHESDGLERFISPCKCRGSLSLVHRSCLQRWLAQSDTSKCELCGFYFSMKRRPKYGLVSSVYAWLVRSARERRKLVLDIVKFVLMCPALCFINFIGFKLSGSLYPDNAYNTLLQDLPLKQEITSQDAWDRILAAAAEVIILSLMMTLDVAFLMWILLKIQHHTSKWYSWYRRNCEVTLIGYKELTQRKTNSVQEQTNSADRIRSISF